MFKSQLWWVLLGLRSFKFKHPQRNEDCPPCTNGSSLLHNSPLPAGWHLWGKVCPNSAFRWIFFSFPQTPAAPPPLIPSLQREILAVGPLGFLLSFSPWALELFLARGTFTVNPAGIHSAVLPCPQLSSCLWPTPAHTAVGLLSALQGPLIPHRRCYWKPQGTNSHLSNTIIKLSSVLVGFSIGKAKWH